jgi:hypothetical protein
MGYIDAFIEIMEAINQLEITMFCWGVGWTGLKVAALTKLVTIDRATSGWSIGIMWPALCMVLNSSFPTFLKNPLISPLIV